MDDLNKHLRRIRPARRVDDPVAQKQERVAQKAIELGSIKKAEEVLGVTVKKDAKLLERIRRRRADHAEALAIDARNILREYARIAFFDPANLFDPDTGEPLPLTELDEDTARALSVEITSDGIKMKPADKLRALEILAKRLNLF